MNGKGSTRRPENSKAIEERWACIDWTPKPDAKRKRKHRKVRQ